MLNVHAKSLPVTCLKEKKTIFELQFPITPSLLLIFKPMTEGLNNKGASPN